MKNYLLKFLSKYFLFFISLIIIIAIFFGAINIALLQSEDKISSLLYKNFNQKITLKSVYYIPPNRLILKDISFTAPRIFGELLDDSSNKPIRISKIVLTFSLKSMILDRRFNIREIAVHQPIIDISQYAITMINPRYILKKINEVAKDNNLRLKIKNAQLDISSNDRERVFLRVNSFVSLKGGKSLYSHGDFTLENFDPKCDCRNKDSFDFQPLRYKFSGYLNEADLLIEKVELDNGPFYLKVWGDFKDNLLRVNGVSSVKNILDDEASSQDRSSTNKGDWFFPFFNKSAPQVIGYSTSNIDIFDLHCAIRAAATSVIIEEMKFSINNIPFSVEGEISFLGSSGINIKVTSFPSMPQGQFLHGIKRVDFGFSGNLDDRSFNGKTTLKALKITQGREVSHQIEVLFKKLDLNFLSGKELGITFDDAGFSYKVGDDLYGLFFSNFNALCDIGSKNFKTIKFKSNIYDGLMQGDGYIDFSKRPFKSGCNIEIDNVSANKLSAVSSYFKRIHGKFNSTMKYESYPEYNLEGNLIVNDGYFDNLLFFSWLSNFFELPTLRTLEFKSVYSDFSVSDEGRFLDNINLDSQGTSLSGYFKIFDNDLVASHLSLVLFRDILRDSPKFNSLLKILGDDVQSIAFDFQLSGLFDAMNFKWLETDFKTGLKRAIPSFMERGIERRIERAIKDISLE